jgi:TatD DNase family protein
LQRAANAGVNYLFLPNIDLDSIEEMHKLSISFPKKCFPMMGLHPCSVKENFLEILEKMKTLLNHNKYYGIGETGIDLYWDKTFIEQQKQSFKIQIQWAKDYNLPLIIHCRNAFSEILEILDEQDDKNLKGIFHCFNGNAEQAAHILKYNNFLLGIGGVLTYKNSGLEEVIKNIPIEKIVLETDSPYLAPTPFRGKRNEPAYITEVAKKLTEIYGVSFEEVAKKTSINAFKIFQINV